MNDDEFTWEIEARGENMDMDMELTGKKEYHSVKIPEIRLILTATYMEDVNSMTHTWDFEVVEGNSVLLTDELKEKIIINVLENQSHTDCDDPYQLLDGKLGRIMLGKKG